MDAEQLWQTAKGELQLQLTQATYETWLSNSKGVSFEDGVLTVAVHNTFVRDWLENRLLPSDVDTGFDRERHIDSEFLRIVSSDIGFFVHFESESVPGRTRARVRRRDGRGCQRPLRSTRWDGCQAHAHAQGARADARHPFRVLLRVRMRGVEGAPTGQKPYSLPSQVLMPSRNIDLG